MPDHLPAPYPLAWPPGRPRTPAERREQGHYSLRLFSDAIGSIEREVRRWQRISRDTRISNWELTTNHIGRAGQPVDPGAALWFTIGGRVITGAQSLMVLACDKFRELPQNVRAISLTMERLRLVDEIGAYSLISAVEGAKALPPPDAEIDWRAVLGLGETATIEAANAVYRALARDAGEGSDKLRELNLAIDAARRELEALLKRI